MLNVQLGREVGSLDSLAFYQWTLPTSRGRRITMAGSSEQLLEQKRNIYKLLDASTRDDDDAPDPGREASVQAMGRSSSTTATSRTTQGLKRSVSDSTIVPPRPQRQREVNAISPIGKPSSSARQPRAMHTRHTVPAAAKELAQKLPPVRTVTSMATGKRKRRYDPPASTDGPQLFHGKVFYFFPNTDKHPARKTRIAKAIEFGATWTRDFTDNVTHVIADKNMDYGLLMKFLRREALPEHVVLVSEDYTAECISFRTMVDPLHAQFKVKGYTKVQEAHPKPYAIQSSPQLKEVGESVIARRPETPNADVGSISPLSLDVSDDDAVQPPPPVTTDHSTANPSKLNIKNREEIDTAIQQARQLQDVPLDHDDEGFSRPTSSEGPDTEDEGNDEGLQLLKKRKTKFQQFQDRFQCMQKHTGSKAETPNSSTITILQQMADYYDKVGDQWRLRAYRKAMASLRNHPTKVWTREEALALPQIGERLATKIEEIAFTNRLRRLDNAKAEPEDQVLQTFMQIYGVGYAQANKWVNAGFKTIDELSRRAELTENQRIGVQHYEDFNSRIPRAEVEQHGDIVKKYLDRIDPTFEVIVGGSYRRGSDTSGDIDCIITRPNTTLTQIQHIVHGQLIPKLFAKKFLVAALAVSSKDDGSKWHGASQLPPSLPDSSPNPWRRIDFLLVPSDEMGAALIYFTGNDIFNRSMRLLAGTKGMRLNQRGLYKDVIRGKGRQKLSEGTLVEGKDEKRIFEVLGVPWRPPEHRNC